MSKPLILVVETECKKSSLVDLLKPDCNVCLVHTGKDALHAFEENHLRIRLVIMELVLPDLSGIFLLRRFRKISTLAELIVSSCRKDIPLAVGAMKEGAYDYIITPKNRKHLH